MFKKIIIFLSLSMLSFKDNKLKYKYFIIIINKAN